MSWVEAAKRAAVIKALEEVRDAGVIGIGSGSTLELLVSELAKLVRNKSPQPMLIATSHQIEAAMADAGLTTTSPNEVSSIDLALDGADQVELGSLDLIKGGGAAMTREKIIGAAAKRFVIVADERKVTDRLGTGQQVPVEVLPFAYRLVISRLSELGGKPTLRCGRMKLGPVITDNGNFIVDVDFGPLKDAPKLERQLRSIPGLLETGLFLNMADRVYVGRKDGTVQVVKPK